VPKTWLEQTLFLGLAAAVWLATRQIRRCSVADPRVMEPQ